MEKYGFVYKWHDKKRNMFYIGCHWGTEDDGYKCSSKRLSMAMLKSKRAGKFDQRFKREILKTDIPKESLLIEEYKFLKQIPKEELGKKYYNLSNYLFPARKIYIKHKNEAKEIISQKLKQKWLDPKWRQNQINKRTGKRHSEEHKEKISQGCKGKTLGRTKSEAHKQKMCGRKWSEELRQKLSKSQKGKIPWNKGKTNIFSEETKQRMSISAKNRGPNNCKERKLNG